MSQGGVTTQEVIVQSIVSFIVLFVLARVLGKRQMAQLNFFDYIVGITVGNVAASWSLDDVTNLHAVCALVIWTGLCLLLAYIQRKSYRIRLWLDGKELILISQGKIMEENLKRANLDAEELMEMLRQKSIFKLSDVEQAVFENNGQLSVMQTKASSPVTPTDLQLQVIPEHAPRIVVIDGHVMQRALKLTGMSREWLLEEVRKQGAKEFQDVFLAQIDSNGNVYVDLYYDTLKLATTVEKPMVAAKIKGIQADLESFALQTNNLEAKAAYTQMSQQMRDINERVLPYLRE